MTTCRRGTILTDIGILFELGVVSHLSDGELLERFVTRSGEPAERAFAVLIERHGPMVLRVCRNILSDQHEVEDAFQATFLVLLRKAGSIRKRASCGSWLHGVALRAAAQIRTENARRRAHEQRHMQVLSIVHAPTEATPQDELRDVIDQELGRLQERFRSPLVLCYLEGHTCEEAARQLGWPVGTVKSRLARGRERLRTRLARRGVAPAIGITGTLALPPVAKAAVPPTLAAKTVSEVARVAASGTLAGAVPLVVASVLRSELSRGLARGVACFGALLAGVALVACAAALGQRQDASSASPAQAVARKTAPAPIHAQVVDLAGKPVAGAEVRAYGVSEQPEVFVTDAAGRVMIPRTFADEPFSLLARRDEALGWTTRYPARDAQVPGAPATDAGTRNEPIVLTLFPRSRKLEGRVSDTQRRPIAGARVVIQNLERAGHHMLVLVRSLLEAEG
ncbi:MAG TPA: sigma-70 family RNA polymerase sigma factor, partial [Polyangiaceae bacterium]|nr:sigma-70 family RNA polymerase sigma factor [Polyangiaceae bacterium]